MSRAAKTTFALSAALSALVVVGVHWQQSAERETMYQGVLRDQARMEAKRAAAASAAAAAAAQEEADARNRSSGNSIVAPPLPPSQLTPEARYQDWLRNREREEEFQRVQPTRGFLEREREQQQQQQQQQRTERRI